ncbi:hypothetical protein E9993_12865 [Labilibacter sediminis]|nr:hypothetical protein E9993_12865 [Labilibacter sediminis]
MTKNRYSHIKSFEDFKKEKMRLYYEVQLSEKKLEIKRLELKEYINPIRLFASIFQELAKPMFEFVQSMISKFFSKKKDEANPGQNKTPEKPSEECDD